MFLEVIATSLQDIKNINNSEANQVELCTAMEFGGYTPSYQLIAEACQLSLKPVMVMIRNNNNGFNVTDSEFQVFKKDITFIKTTDASGIVCGILTKNNIVDIERMREIIELAKPLRVTFHRAFDEITNKKQALEQLVKLGVSTVLTSGGKNNIIDNINNFKILKKLNLPITILAGGGVDLDNINLLLKNGITDIHVGKCVHENNSFNKQINKQIINKIKTMG